MGGKGRLACGQEGEEEAGKGEAMGAFKEEKERPVKEWK